MSLPTLKSIANPKAAFFKGALWAVGTRWVVKTIGLFSTAILARFLQPQDRGCRN